MVKRLVGRSGAGVLFVGLIGVAVLVFFLNVFGDFLLTRAVRITQAGQVAELSAGGDPVMFAGLGVRTRSFDSLYIKPQVVFRQQDGKLSVTLRTEDPDTPLPEGGLWRSPSHLVQFRVLGEGDAGSEKTRLSCGFNRRFDRSRCRADALLASDRLQSGQLAVAEIRVSKPRSWLPGRELIARWQFRVKFKDGSEMPQVALSGDDVPQRNGSRKSAADLGFDPEKIYDDVDMEEACAAGQAFYGISADAGCFSAPVLSGCGAGGTVVKYGNLQTESGLWEVGACDPSARPRERLPILQYWLKSRVVESGAVRQPQPIDVNFVVNDPFAAQSVECFDISVEIPGERGQSVQFRDVRASDWSGPTPELWDSNCQYNR